MKNKIIINIIGPRGVGKSTLGAKLLGEDRTRASSRVILASGKETTVVYSTAASTKGLMLGTPNGGTDHCGSMLGGCELIKQWVTDTNINFIIVNPVRCSRSWNVNFFAGLQTRVVYVIFDVSFEEVIRRITPRRLAVGKSAVLSDAEILDLTSFYQRSKRVSEYAVAMLRPQDTVVKLNDKDSLLISYKKVKALL